MTYLIFRTDRIGDFLITSILINSIKQNDKKSRIFVVASTKNNEFIKGYNLVDKIFLLKSKGVIDRINLFLELNKYKFDNIIVSDKKNRSIFFGLFLKSKNKIFNVSKNYQNKLLRIFYNNVYIDNDDFKNISIEDILSKNSASLNFELKKQDFHYLKDNQFKKEFLHSSFVDLDKLNFILVHYDEKWEIENYSKAFKKASSLTDINVKKDILVKFMLELSKKTSKRIVLSTGTIETKIINELKALSKKINESLYEVNLDGNKVYMFTKENFFSISHLISKSSLLITCHGAFVHIASNYNIKIIDIIEKSKYIHYNKITKHIQNYKHLYRDNCEALFKEIINNS